MKNKTLLLGLSFVAVLIFGFVFGHYIIKSSKGSDVRADEKVIRKIFRRLNFSPFYLQ